jgi:uncharacterized protein YcbK (DUF882 family)
MQLGAGLDVPGGRFAIFLEIGRFDRTIFLVSLQNRLNSSMELEMRSLTRAIFVILGLAAVGSISGSTGEPRVLKFFHTHTGKTLQVVYFRQGEYDAQAMAELKVFLADWRNGEQHDIDPQLMDILWRIQQTTGSGSAWEVISAYRSPETNEMLRSRSNGVARKSQHMLGTAIDVRLRDVELASLRDTARMLKMGGVGYYAGSNFVHVDTGRVRYW